MLKLKVYLKVLRIYKKLKKVQNTFQVSRF